MAVRWWKYTSSVTDITWWQCMQSDAGLSVPFLNSRPYTKRAALTVVNARVRYTTY